MIDPEDTANVEIKDESASLQCSICGNTILPEPETGWTGGHNASPVNDGRCCSHCNSTVVVPTRLKKMLDDRAKKDFPRG
jgi:transcription elongation factor Elf1